MRIALIAITRNGALLGQRLREGLVGAELYMSGRYGEQAGSERHLFEPADLKVLITSLWHKVDGFVFIMASGIVVRIIAPHLESKEADPAVVVMDDAGKFAVSLLSGHLGGANELAERCALISKARAVITTATDVNDLPSFDMLAKEQGWVIDDISQVKLLNSLLLNGEEIAVVDHSGQTRSLFRGKGKLSFYDTFTEALDSPAPGFLFVTNRQLSQQNLPKNLLVLRPRNLILGIGCNRGTPQEEIDDFVAMHLRRSRFSLKSVCSIATAEAKRDETGLIAFAEHHALPLVFFTSEELNRVAVPSPPSQHALEAIGAAGVAEPAAILASGGGRLLLNKVKSANVTLAIAINSKGTKMNNLPLIAITMGDPCGVGPEITIKALQSPDIMQICVPFVIGDRKAMERALSVCGSGLVIHEITQPEDSLTAPEGSIPLLVLSQLSETDLHYGRPTAASGDAVFRYICTAAGFCLGGRVAAMVTAPINKEAMNRAGHDYPGHTELLAELCGTKDYVMMLAGDVLRVSLVTIHEALEDVPRLVTYESVLKTIRLTEEGVRRLTGIPRPRLAVLALNPHCGEGGLFGKEEGTVISPAIKTAQVEGIDAVGPLSADTLFHFAQQGAYDGIVAMYHDQGLIPMKMLHFDDGVNITLGLPIIRTSVDHGTAYDLAGTGKASEKSMLMALKMAVGMVPIVP